MAFYPTYDHPREMRTGVPCPECGHEIVYSGNYYCSQYEGDSPACMWAMPDSENEDPLFKRCLRGLKKNQKRVTG